MGAIVGQKLWLLTGKESPVQGTSVQGAPKQQDNHQPHEVSHQVLCITHLPQLAAFGDFHYAVNKRVYAANGEERTGTVVRQLEGDDRLDELTQMLGASGSAGRRSVEEMMGEVGEVKAGKHVLK